MPGSQRLENPAMRKAAGIAFIFFGVIGLAICGIVFLRLSLPAPAWLTQHVRTLGVLWDPVEGLLSSLVSLAIGVLLLRRKEEWPA